MPLKSIYTRKRVSVLAMAKAYCYQPHLLPKKEVLLALPKLLTLPLGGTSYAAKNLWLADGMSRSGLEACLSRRKLNVVSTTQSPHCIASTVSTHAEASRHGCSWMLGMVAKGRPGISHCL